MSYTAHLPRPPLHFAHANSFPASVYRKLLAELSLHYEVGFIDAIGHNPAFPVSDCWPHLVRETIAHIEANYREPVWGVGHSLGGFMVFYAAIERPDLFRGIAILDSPLMGPMRSRGIWLAKRLGFIHKVTPGKNTLTRRDNWAGVDSVRDYFARKPMFARWDADCLADYARHGTVDNGAGGRRLKFRPAIEHAIYCTLPHNHPRLSGRLKVPGVFVAGADSDVLRKGDLAWMQRHFGLHVVHQRGSHLFPLEHPLETAHLLRAQLERLAGRA
ncbi:alpha/beta fold hydrolase [Crenobacter intestini]|uniref:Alpha/beta hydrolase n=1 Tax=Crenobacter intestini TaxID=2563443 RepID=A0A4V4N948_9NEIS|nr:alpha/beta hydrolase [Crenobacter intestini]TIC87023.1 alpha/beta hydrolase [Crenobacter intestini]